MPGRKRSHAASVEWNRAIQLAGSEARLTAGVKQKTWEGWARDGVPAYRLVPIFEERIQQLEPGAPHHCQFLDFVAMVAGYKAMRRVLLALTEGKDERRRAEKILVEAERLKKLDTEVPSSHEAK